MESQQSNTGPSMGRRVDAVISAARLLAELGDCRSITITTRGSSGGFCVAIATQSSDGSEMTLKVLHEGNTIYAPLRLFPSSER